MPKLGADQAASAASGGHALPPGTMPTPRAQTSRGFPPKPEKPAKIEPTRTMRGAKFDNIENLLLAASVLADSAGYAVTRDRIEQARRTLAAEFDEHEKGQP